MPPNSLTSSNSKALEITSLRKMKSQGRSFSSHVPPHIEQQFADPSSTFPDMKPSFHMMVAPLNLSEVYRLTLLSNQNDLNIAPSSVSLGMGNGKGSQKGKSNRNNNNNNNQNNHHRNRRCKKYVGLTSRFAVLPYPRGLLNNKNDCFMNAVLQMLLFIPGFAQLAVSVAESPPAFAFLSPTMCVLGKWCMEYWKPSLPLSPLLLPRLPISAKTASFANEQQDAQEYLLCLLEQIDDELMKLERQKLSRGSSQTKAVPSSISKIQDLKGWTVVEKGKEKLSYRMHAGRHSVLLSSLLGGLTDSRLSGNAKNRVSATVETFFTLSLKIAFKYTCTVGEALEHAFQKEAIEGIDSTILYKSTLFSELPRILILHFCRWATTAEGEAVKIDNEVVCQPTLTIPALLCTDHDLPPSERLYRLVSAVAHRGVSAQSGHYVTYLTGVHAADPFSPLVGREPPCSTNAQGDLATSSSTVGGPSCEEALTAQGSAARVPKLPPRGKVPNGKFILCDDASISLVDNTSIKKESIYMMAFEKVNY